MCKSSVTRWYKQNDCMAEGRILGNAATKILTSSQNHQVEAVTKREIF